MSDLLELYNLIALRQSTKSLRKMKLSEGSSTVTSKTSGHGTRSLYIDCNSSASGKWEESHCTWTAIVQLVDHGKRVIVHGLQQFN